MNEKKRIERKPKLYWIRRKPNGEKRVRIKGRRHGKTIEVEYTIEEIIKDVEEA